MPAPSSPIWTRKRDLLYLIFFIYHISVMLIVDLPHTLPDSIRPQFTTNLREWYVAEYKDPLFINPPSWFNACLVWEVIYQIPLILWAVPALLRNDPLVPLNLLVWGISVAACTLACALEQQSAPYLTHEEKMALAKLYFPYLIPSVGASLDMFYRVKGQIEGKVKTV